MIVQDVGSKSKMKSKSLIAYAASLLKLLSFAEAELYKPNTPIHCSKDSKCPQEWPCCSAYGECGAGPMCVGACNPRFSFNDQSCIPSLGLVPEHGGAQYNVVRFDADLNLPLVEQVFNERGVDKSKEITVNSDLKLEGNGLIHHSNYLVTKNQQEADHMARTYNFTYSGHTSMDPHTGDIILGMPQRTTGSMIASTRNFLYGRAGARLRTARSQGVITALVLISPTGDEIDFEFLGSELKQVQTNYYSRGELIHTRMVKINVPFDTYSDYHNYEISWSPDAIEWIIDNKIVRTLSKQETWDDSIGDYKFPQTPMRMEAAIWPGGADENEEGTISWAGGRIDWDNSPDIINEGQFAARVKQVKIEPYNHSFLDSISKCFKDPNSLNSISVQYNGSLDPNYGEKSLVWSCDRVPYVPGWTASGNTRKQRLGRFRIAMSEEGELESTPTEGKKSRKITSPTGIHSDSKRMPSLRKRKVNKQNKNIVFFNTSYPSSHYDSHATGYIRPRNPLMGFIQISLLAIFTLMI